MVVPSLFTVTPPTAKLVSLIRTNPWLTAKVYVSTPELVLLLVPAQRLSNLPVSPSRMSTLSLGAVIIPVVVPSPVRVRFPLMVAWFPSMVKLPPAAVSLPVISAVSAVRPPVTVAPPLMSAPPLAVSLPVKVVVPVTERFPPTAASLFKFVLPVTSRVLFKVVAPVTPKVLPKVVAPVTVRAFPTVALARAARSPAREVLPFLTTRELPSPLGFFPLMIILFTFSIL